MGWEPEAKERNRGRATALGSSMANQQSNIDNNYASNQGSIHILADKATRFGRQ